MGAGDAPRSDVERRRAGPPIDSGVDRRGLGGGQSPALDTPVERRLLDCGGRRAPAACFGICALRTPARGLPIRPVLKHGPRSPTCVRVNGRVNP
ncbi:unnamed protein product [Withania somnifera]